jgi:TonB family protein
MSVHPSCYVSRAAVPLSGKTACLILVVHMQEATPTRNGNTTQAGGTQPDKQRVRLLIAIVLLLGTLVAVLVKDRGYWFGSEENDANAVEVAQPVQATSAQVQVPQASPAPVAKATTAHIVSRHSVRPNLKPATMVSQWGPATNAADPVQMASIKAPVPDSTEYPLLAGQMAVQGSVLLQALIAADGAVEDLRVLSGPAILASAAQEAVRQWKFKPYLENGKPVETQARVTVNFTIKVSNNTARVQSTSVTSDGAL